MTIRLAALRRPFLRPRRNGSVKGPADGREAVSRGSPIVFGTLTIDVAVVAEPPGSIIEQKLTADSALTRRKKYRAGVNLIVAGPDVWRNSWRHRRCRVRWLGRKFFVHEQAKREKSRDHNNCLQGTAGARAGSWWTLHPAIIGKIN